MTGPVEEFRDAAEPADVLARRRRCPTPWSGRRSIIGLLDDDDVSLTFDAGPATVLRHQQRPAARWSATTCSTCSPRRSPATPATRTCTGSATSATPAAPTCPAPADCAGVPDAVWMRVRDAAGFVDHAPPGRRARLVVAGDRSSTRPRSGTRDAFAEVQEQLRLGNSYEVNLTYRERRRQRRRPGDGVPPAARGQPRAVRRLPAAPADVTTSPAQLLARSGSPRSTGTRDARGPARSRAPPRAVRRPRRTSGCGGTWPPTRSSAPRT